MGRRLDDVRLWAMMLDGMQIAERCRLSRRGAGHATDCGCRLRTRGAGRLAVATFSLPLRGRPDSARRDRASYRISRKATFEQRRFERRFIDLNARCAQLRCVARRGGRRRL
jgi:hypothetical protein